ncbi:MULTISPECIES: hypothetical protein [Saccharothrix]|uniref:hypothetical protein n=1 Tax=Saccharothrix TaxID=2071 RepID=UPI00093C8825|nr:hypothetical protein [Saccharothrix sp. CB00851]OKI36236.1 hypothetical protein A6A25_22895 [Saccharothrix sp. CB00851]
MMAGLHRIVREFALWLVDHNHPGADVDDAALLLDLLGRHLGVTDPAELERGDLAELLLDVLPGERGALTARDPAGVVPTARALLAFFVDTERLPAERATRFSAELDSAEPDFVPALLDVSGWDESDDVFSVDLSAALGLPSRLPPVRLPDTEALATAARASGLFAMVRKLAVWVGEQRPVTEVAELEVADTAEAIGVLGVTEAEFTHLWRVAAAMEFIDFDDDVTVAVAGPSLEDWPSAEDETALELWSDGFGHLLVDPLALDDEEGEVPFLVESTGMLVALAMFFSRSEGAPVAELRDAVMVEATGEHNTTQLRAEWADWIAANGDPADVLLERMSKHGAVEFVDDSARLTPLGTWGMRERLRAGGIQVPLLPPVEQMSARDLIAAADGFTTDELTAERSAWLASRDADAAIADLLRTAADGDAAERVFAVSIVNELDADDHWRKVADTVPLGPYARIALGGQPDAVDAAWLTADMLAAAWSPDDIGGLVEQFATVVPEGLESDILEMLWRVPHPEVPSVLKALGEGHPNKKIAKAARKAAFKTASLPRS